MSNHENPREADEGAPLLPGGNPELAGTGPDGAIRADDGSVSPEEVPDEDPQGESREYRTEGQLEDER